jgi:hypothetical protein
MEEKNNWILQLNKIAISNIDILRTSVYSDNSIIIFDIDNTLLDSEGNRISAIVTLYDYIKLLEIPIAIITSRIGTKENIEKTQKQLYTNKILGYKYIYFLKPLDYDVYNFKNKARKDIMKKGYKIIMTIGDSDWDLYHGDNSIAVKVPVYHVSE